MSARIYGSRTKHTLAISLIVMAGCSAVGHPQATPSSSFRVEIVKNSFDVRHLQVPARVQVDIVVDNQAVGIPHNLAVYTDDTATEAIVVGEVEVGPAIQTIELPALAPGTYFFRCDIHRIEMVGALDAVTSPGASP